MALKGNLRDFPITQILNLINLARKSGALYIDSENGNAVVYFRDGKLTYAFIGRQEKSLLKVLLEKKKISNAQYSLLAPKMANLSDKEVGLDLINGDYVGQDETFQAIEEYLSDLMRQVFTWSDGSFHFEASELPPDDKIPSRINLENLIVEGSRDQLELDELKAEIPSLEMALKFTDRPGTNIHKINLSAEEWQVISYVNPKNTIQQIALKTKMNDLEIRRSVFTLLQAGLVVLIRPDGVAVSFGGRKIQPLDGKKQVNIVNRLIDRIRSI